LSADALGSIVATNDPAGAVSHSVVFDAWGNTKSEVGVRQHPFAYTGREVGQAGQLFYRARFYQTGIGRFGAEDPIRGASSAYSYVANRPMLYVDPSGLKCCPKNLRIEMRPRVHHNSKNNQHGADVSVRICADAENPRDCKFQQFAKQHVDFLKGRDLALGLWEEDGPPDYNVEIRGKTICMLDSPGQGMWNVDHGPWQGLAPSAFPILTSAQFITRIFDKSDPSDYRQIQWAYIASCPDPWSCRFWTFAE
ncbi:MAG: RHS repeat-associated core domain-containing protein, partial [Acidobacteria bacterium]|nr:RHS repeat-associated core domain-containing protein [Acidobacteriota bacterium]